MMHTYIFQIVVSWNVDQEYNPYKQCKSQNLKELSMQSSSVQEPLTIVKGAT